MPPNLPASSPLSEVMLSPGALADVPGLISSSRVPRRGFQRPANAVWIALAAMVVAMLPIDPLSKIVLQMVLWGGFVTVLIFFWILLGHYKSEMQAVAGIEDALALKRNDQAAQSLRALMSRPMYAHLHRLRAMAFLAATLARTQRHEEALMVYDELIVNEQIAEPGASWVGVGRAMSMLHCDHLYDADRAIVELRRSIDRGSAPNISEEGKITSTADPVTLAALRLVELFRDIKTGHAEEAVALFETHVGLMTEGLGHRVGEAHALVAVAYDRLGNTDRANQRFLDATALQGVGDMLNRYPELRPLLTRYSPTPAPKF